MKKTTGIFLIMLILLSSGASGYFYLTTPVKAEVFKVVIPNANMGVLDFHVIGSYELHLTDVNLSGFFEYANDTAEYDIHIGSADVVYTASLTDDMNISISYSIDYRDFNFSVSADSFQINVDYAQFSSRGELEIKVLNDNAIQITVFEMVPRYAKVASEWAPLEIGIIRQMEVSAT